MTATTHTPLTPDLLLMRYAAGVLPPYESMVMAAYLTVSAEARRKMAAYEAAGGRMIDSEEPVSVTQNCLNNILAMTQPQQPCAEDKPCPDALVQDAGDCTIPRLLRKLVNAHCPQQALAWEHLSHGIAKIDITLCRSEPRARRLRLLKLAPHQATPAHSHHGTELTLVLEGSYADSSGHYRAGELVVVSAPGISHSPRAQEQGCICLTLTEAPVRFDSLVTQMLSFFRGL